MESCCFKEAVSLKGAASRFMKRITAAVLAAILVVPFFHGTAFGAMVPWPEGCYVASEGACIIDADTGVVLYGKNEHESFYPASITKVMTAILTLENCEDLTEMVTFSREAVTIEEDNSTIIGASEGDMLTVQDCLYSLLFQSANEVANALAEHVGAKHEELREEGESDRDVFVKMMNQKARELGCVNTHFNNPSGLTDPEHWTSPYDMCLIMAEACRDERFVEIESRTYWTHAPIKRYPDQNDPWNTVYPKHSMLKRNSDRYYEGAFAGKTGYTSSAGNTLVTACERNGMRLIVTVMNAHNNHYNDTQRLFDYGYDNFESLYISDYDDTAGMVEEDMSISGIALVDGTTLGIDDDSKVTVPRGGEFSDISKSLELSDDGSSADIVYYYGDRQAGRAQIGIIPLGGSMAVAEAREDPLFIALTAGSEMPKVQETGEIETVVSLSEETASEESMSDAEGQSAEISSGQETSAAGEEAGSEDKGWRLSGVTRIVIVILAAFALVVAAVLGVTLHIEKREAKARERRRRRRLRHTRDLTGQQNIKMDMLVQQSLRKNKRKRKR